MEQLYAWADVKNIAAQIFSDARSKYDFHWAQDMWNIHMHQSVVVERTKKRELTSEEQVDVTLWLLAMYDLYIDYLEVVGQGMRGDFHLTKEGYRKHIFDKLVQFGNEFIESLFLWYIRRHLRLRLKQLENIEDYESNVALMLQERMRQTRFVTTHLSSGEDPLVGIFLNQIVLETIFTRRTHLIQSVFNYFGRRTNAIIAFMTGHHWRQNYTDYDQQLEALEEEKQQREMYFEEEGFEDFQESFFSCNKATRGVHQLSLFKRTRTDFEREYEELLEELRRKYAVSVEDMNKELYNEKYRHIPPLREWIEMGMPHLYEFCK